MGEQHKNRNRTRAIRARMELTGENYTTAARAYDAERDTQAPTLAPQPAGEPDEQLLPPAPDALPTSLRSPFHDGLKDLTGPDYLAQQRHRDRVAADVQLGIEVQQRADAQDPRRPFRVMGTGA